MPPTLTTHHSSEALKAFARGCLDETTARTIEEHIQTCPECSQLVEQTSGDEFAFQLRSAWLGRSGQGTESRLAGNAETAEISGVPSVVARAPVTDDPAAVPPELADHPRYRVLRRVGGGGMGDVYLALHIRMERQVALKVMNPRLIHAQALSRFVQEVKTAARLEHPNIVRAYDADAAGSLHFLVMEFVEGTDLATYVRKQGRLPWNEACRLIVQAALGLQHAHEAGMVHRDIKPHNLMLTRDGRVKVLDFGLARFAREAAEDEQSGTSANPAAEVLSTNQEGLTLPGTLMGTADYMAPEQAGDARDADIRADVYSLGCTLFYLLTGRVLFPADSVKDKVAAHRADPPPEIRELRPDVPPALAQLLARMLAKQPADRPQTPAEVITALQPLASDTASEPMSAKPAPLSSKQRMVRVLLATAALFLFGWLGVTVIRIQTNQGEIIVTTESSDVQVVVLRGGQEVELIDTKTDKKVRLAPGDYALQLRGDAKGLTISPETFTLKRNDTVLAKVEFRKAPVPVPEPARDPAAKPAPQQFTEASSYSGHEGRIIGASISQDGRYAVTAGFDRTVRLWDLQEGKEVHVLRGHTGQVYFADLSADGKLIVSGGDDNDCRLWDAKTGEQIRTFSGNWVTCVRFSPDGKTVAASGFDGLVRIWETATGNEIRRLAGHRSIAQHVAFAPNGDQLASCSGHWDPDQPQDNTIRLWNLKTGEETRRLEGHTGLITCISYSRDGRRLLSGSYDGSIRLWDPQAARAIAVIPGVETQLHDVALDAAGHWALTTGSSGRLRLWDLASSQELATVAAHERFSNNPLFLPDGEHVLSTGGEGLLKVWRLPKLVRTEGQR